jgi:hypothetical protein
MSDEIITRLVVGDPMRVTLGRPVGQRADHGTKPAALRWRDGTWITSPGPKASKGKAPKSFQVPLQRIAARATASRKYGAAALASVAAIAIGAGGAMLWRSQSASSLPIAPAVAAAPPAVKVVTAPYSPDARSDSPLPIAPLQAQAPRFDTALPSAEGPVPRPLPPVAVSGNGPGLQPQPAAVSGSPAAKPKDEQAPRVPAVLLDDPAPTGAQRAAAAQGSPVKPGTSNTTVPSKQPDQAKPPAVRGVGLVAITPDGKSAVFTNPKTRLPEQFKVGDQLPSGETVRSVDYKEGKVVTSSKEYSLD